MSIVDKLPEAPDDYKWVSEVFQSDRSGNPTVYLHLDVISTVPIVPEGYGSTFEFCEADEEEIVQAAHRILSKFDKGIQESIRKQELQTQLNKTYAGLITGRS